MRAIGYVRVSTDKQADHGDLELCLLALKTIWALRSRAAS